MQQPFPHRKRIVLLVAGAMIICSDAVFKLFGGGNHAAVIALASRIRRLVFLSSAESKSKSDGSARWSDIHVLKPHHTSLNVAPSRQKKMLITYKRYHQKLSSLNTRDPRADTLGDKVSEGASHSDELQHAKGEIASPVPAPISSIGTASGNLPPFSATISPLQATVSEDGGKGGTDTAIAPPRLSIPLSYGPALGSVADGETRGGATNPQILVVTYYVLADKFMHMECDYAEFLVRNRGEYAMRHGYGYSVVTKNLETSRPLAWGKVRALQRWMGEWHKEWNSNVAGAQGFPPYREAVAADRARAASEEGGEAVALPWDGPEWIFIIDADAFITNPEVRIEELIDPDYDIILTKDTNGINSGTMLLRNGPWLADYWARIWDMTQYITHSWWEQAAMIELMEDAIPFLAATVKRELCF